MTLRKKNKKKVPKQITYIMEKSCKLHLQRSQKWFNSTTEKIENSQETSDILYRYQNLQEGDSPKTKLDNDQIQPHWTKNYDTDMERRTDYGTNEGIVGFGRFFNSQFPWSPSWKRDLPREQAREQGLGPSTRAMRHGRSRFPSSPSPPAPPPSSSSSPPPPFLSLSTARFLRWESIWYSVSTSHNKYVEALF